MMFASEVLQLVLPCVHGLPVQCDLLDFIFHLVDAGLDI